MSDFQRTYIVSKQLTALTGDDWPPTSSLI